MAMPSFFTVRVRVCVPTQSVGRQQIFLPLVRCYHQKYEMNTRRSLMCQSSSSSFLSPSLELNKSIKPQFTTTSVSCTPRSVNDQLLRQQDDNDDDSLSSRFLSTLHLMFRDLFSGLVFLWEQPGELKYLEFPSLQSAGTMALFTVAVVMVLIVILASVDSGLGYFVARLFSRIS